MAKTTLDSLEYRHGTKSLTKRGAPDQVKSTEMKSFASPIDMTGSVMGKRATNKVAKSNRNEVHPLQSDNNPVGRGGQARGIPNSPYRSYMKASGTPTPVPTPKKSTKSPTPVPEAKPRIYDVSYPTPNRTTPTPILPEDRRPSPVKKPIQRGSDLVAASKPSSLKKDIDSGFVPSIGVKRGKQSDLQSPAKNAYPPHMKKDISTAGFVPSIGIKDPMSKKKK
jgi:hypothetical protein